MRKSIIFILALVAFAGSAFAAVQTAVPSGLTGFAPSNNVMVGYQPSATNDTYAIATGHKAGNSIFGTTSGSTAIYKQVVTGSMPTDLSTKTPSAPTAPSDSVVQNGGTWTSM